MRVPCLLTLPVDFLGLTVPITTQLSLSQTPPDVPLPGGGSAFLTRSCTPASGSGFQPGHLGNPINTEGNLSASLARWQDLKLPGLQTDLFL